MRLEIKVGDHVYVPVLNKGDSYRWMPGKVEKMMGRCIYVRYQIGEVRLLGCWFPEEIRRRSE